MRGSTFFIIPKELDGRRKLYGFEGSYAVPARTSGEGRLEKT